MFALLKTIRIFAPLLKREAYGRLAQLVQSICLTSRGSAVRIRQRPLHLPLSFQNCNFRAFSSAGSEHLPYKQRVGGSNPSTPTENIFKRKRKTFGRLAQLVQSICLTSRGSAVRIRQRPQKMGFVSIDAKPIFLCMLFPVGYGRVFLWLSRNLVGIIFYTRKVLLTSHYEKRLFEHASQPRVAGSDIRLGIVV